MADSGKRKERHTGGEDKRGVKRSKVCSQVAFFFMCLSIDIHFGFTFRHLKSLWSSWGDRTTFLLIRFSSDGSIQYYAVVDSHRLLDASDMCFFYLHIACRPSLIRLQGGTGKGKWQTPHQQEKAVTRGGGKIEPGDVGIFATCARGQERRATEELKSMFEEVSNHFLPQCWHRD